MFNLIMAIQILSFFFIFKSVSRYSFTIREMLVWLTVFLIVGWASTYFIGVWGAVSLFACFVGISYYKNHKQISALGIFYGAYALIMNSFLGYLAAIPITWLVQLIFRQSSANIEYLPYLFTAMAPPILNEILLRLVRRFVPQLGKQLMREYGKIIFVPVIVLFIIIIVSVYPILSIGNQTGDDSSYHRMILLSMWLLVVVALLYMQFQYHHIRKKELERSRSDQLVQLKEYAAQLEKIYDEFRGFRHDYANILLTLEDGIYREDWDQVKHVFENTVKPTGQFLRKNEYSFVKLRNLHISEVKSILAAKIMLAQQMKIDVSLEIEDPVHSIPMELISFTRILSILLDNAIEAAVATKERRLWIVLLKDSGALRLIIENSSEETVDLRSLGERGYSTKGEGRGLGLFNVQQMLNDHKYASLESENQPHVFSQTLILRKSKSGERL
jgi:two-component system sensor histidine kinase AgrC